MYLASFVRDERNRQYKLVIGKNHEYIFRKINIFISIYYSMVIIEIRFGKRKPRKVLYGSG